MKTRKGGTLCTHAKCLGGKIATLLATMLLLLAPASAMADDGYIVKVVDDGKKLIFTANDGTKADNKACWTLDTWIKNSNEKGNSNLDYNNNITTVSFDPSFADARPTKTTSWFTQMTNLVEIEGLEYLNTSKVTDMFSMFNTCKKLTTLDLSNFNTENVKNMGYMFCYCQKLETLTLGEKFKTNIVEDMRYMFSRCKALKSLDLSNFNTENVTNISQMFNNCTALKSLNLGNNYFKNATDKNSVFDYVSNCKATVGSGFDVSVLTANTDGTYAWLGGNFTLQLTVDEDNADEFAAATESGTAYNKVVLKRTFNDNAWNTLVVPFDITADEAKDAFGKSVQIAKYTGATTNNNSSEDGYEYVLNFETSTDGITANEPVFIYGVESKADSCYIFTGKTVKKATPTKTDDDNNINFEGTYTAGYVPQGNYFIASDNKIYRAANENTNAIKATRATFAPVSANNEAKIASFVIGGETTGINLPATVNRVANGTAYNLQGQRVGPDYKGVVIQQGKKYLRR